MSRISQALTQAGHIVAAHLAPPYESKRVSDLLYTEIKHFKLAYCKRYDPLSPLSRVVITGSGLITTVRLIALSFFNGFHYLGRELINRVKNQKNNWKPVLRSFTLCIAALLYLIYSLVTVGIGPYFTNQKVLKYLHTLLQARDSSLYKILYQQPETKEY